MSGRLKSALSVGAAGALGAWFANFGRLAGGAMSAIDGIGHSALVLVIAGGLWFFYDGMRSRADA
ncbi:hypothetical protein JMG10_16845 [Nostoc ellipsosporum NOK]|uniref:hypothetical protein n=1 Tax=Sphingomonas sp. IBVSS2 TaxID=1985172 RepID=UPI000A2DB171|nr:hypothetical protein [Sphingomonas sp. IBVSS2]MDF2383154.1 hypothetical protein [Nostoc ellipsosporum NOK]OSZ69539.1 hypothetical protein CAP40_01375 [Sphingomonas sp. IBVSS2]